MKRFKIYSKRQKEKEEDLDFYIYDEISIELRWKIFYLIQDTFGKFIGGPYLHSYPAQNERWDNLEYEIKKQYGLPKIAEGKYSVKRLNEYIKNCETEELIDLIELFLLECYKKYIVEPRYVSKENEDKYNFVVNEINYLFKEHRVGYEFIDNQGTRIDSKYLHKETIKPSINLLYNHNFKGPLEEFEEAISFYNKKKYKEAIQNAKSILTKLSINYTEKDTAKSLIKKLFEADLILPSLECVSANLRVIFESGLPTVRNKQAGHGQGIDPKKVQKSYTEFAIHLCGTFIVFLISRYQEKAGNGV